MMEANEGIRRRLGQARPLLWRNPGRRPVAECRDILDRHAAGVAEARARFARFAPLLADFFPELAPTGGVIASELLPIPGMAGMVRDPDGNPAVAARSLFLKADHALLVAGSVKARGGVHAVLCVAERLALSAGLLKASDDDHRILGGPAARELFSRHRISVGSTGNLGLSIGIMGRALGFGVDVHMSREARAWKKERLSKAGVRVGEHAGDYSAACAVARAEAEARPDAHFIDDEKLPRPFLRLRRRRPGTGRPTRGGRNRGLGEAAPFPVPALRGGRRARGHRPGGQAGLRRCGNGLFRGAGHGSVPAVGHGQRPP
jgi:D-serine dehydratase